MSAPLPDRDHQPASHPMSVEEAVRMQDRSGGRLRAFLHDNGRWYCYDLVAELRAEGFTVSP